MRFIVNDLPPDATRLRVSTLEELNGKKVRPLPAWTGFFPKSAVCISSCRVNVHFVYFNACWTMPRIFRTSTPAGKVLQRRAPAAEIVGSGSILSRLAAAQRSNPHTP